MIATFWTGLAMASGREGAAMGDAVALIVYAVLAAFIASVVAGVCWSAYKAQQKGEPVSSAAVGGIGKGLLWFLILAAGSTAVITVLGILFIAFAFLSTDRLGEFWNALVDAWNMPPEQPK